MAGVAMRYSFFFLPTQSHLGSWECSLALQDPKPFLCLPDSPPQMEMRIYTPNPTAVPVMENNSKGPWTSSKSNFSQQYSFEGAGAPWGMVTFPGLPELQEHLDIPGMLRVGIWGVCVGQELDP